MLEAAETGADSGGRFERTTALQRDIKTTGRRLMEIAAERGPPIYCYAAPTH
jgi:hypothetical protein